MLSFHRSQRAAHGEPARLMVILVLLVATTVALIAGGVARFAGFSEAADIFWATGTVVAVAPAVWWVVAALRRGRIGADIIAVLSLVGALAVHEYLAGALIGMMLATGQALDFAAERRAAKDLRSLLERAPRTARRKARDSLQTVPLEEVKVDDVVVVGPGETLPVDATVASDSAILDESALTGEPTHTEYCRGQYVRSGSLNAGAAVELRATATAEQSTYAGVVRLAQQAAAESAPAVRIADRAATWFLPLSLIVAGSAWVISGSAERAVAVLVVATPCPLLLAVPVAIVSGLSRASRIGVVIKDGGALENLGRATTLVLDKTGTVTTGRPCGTDVLTAPEWTPSEVLRLAASADRVSPHVLARAIVAEAGRRGLPLSMPADVVEEAGRGVTATVDDRRVTVGAGKIPSDAPNWATAAEMRARLEGAVIAWVGVDQIPVGAIVVIDPLRRDAPRTLRRLREAGITRMVMLTGDRPAPAKQIGAVLGLDEVLAEQSPADKVARVRAEEQRAVTAMVGDGVNDAPALAAASVGVALGAHGSTASSEAADVVVTTDRLDRLADAMFIARRARRIAIQSSTAGMALSLLAMGFAAAGMLAPAVGALLQEAIDVAVILNALRVLGGRDRAASEVDTSTTELIRRFSAEHDEMRQHLSMLRDVGHLLTSGRREEALTMVERADDFLRGTLLPHEHAEDRTLYPALAGPLGGPEATATMSRMHAEIDRLALLLHAHREIADEHGGIGDDQFDGLLACVYGLHALLSLHFVEEEENYFVLAPSLGE